MEFDSLLKQRQTENRYRRREILSSAQDTQVVIDGKRLLSFCSNDYLGLANDPAVVRAMADASQSWGVGSGAAHLISGHSALHHRLEQELADFTGRSRALLFSTGYMANLGVITALCGKSDLVVEDKLNHASLIDGGLYSGATFRRYQHADMQHLEKILIDATERQRLIVTDGVFSMDGDLAPLIEIMQLAQKYSAKVLVDDAHGLGVLGVQGGGVCQQFSLHEDDQPILMGTLGKAFGVFGAFIAGSDSLIEWLIQKARSYIYTTALPSALAAASLESLRIIRTEPQRREHLQMLVQYFRESANAMGLQLLESPSPIQPVILGDEETALKWSQQLRDRGLLVKAIRPPTVPVGTARLRITFSAKHSLNDVKQLLGAIKELTP